jgi:hypothetical protein
MRGKMNLSPYRRNVGMVEDQFGCVPAAAAGFAGVR